MNIIKGFLYFFVFLFGVHSVSACTGNLNNEKANQEKYRQMNESVSKGLGSNRRDYSEEEPMPSVKRR